jgi:hypothetical protein
MGATKHTSAQRFWEKVDTIGAQFTLCEIGVDHAA